MNLDKTQLLWIGTWRPQLSEVAVNEVALSTGPLGFSTVVSNLGVLFDEQLSMADHVTAVCKSCFFQLRQLRFISSCLDYCNIVYWLELLTASFESCKEFKMPQHG